MGVGKTRFCTRRKLFVMGAGGTVESMVEFEMGGEWTCLAETCLEEESSDIRLATDLCARYWSVILGNFLLNRSTTFTNAVKSLRQM